MADGRLMAALRYRSGGSSVTVGRELADLLDRIEGGAFKAGREALGEAARVVAEQAARQWYQQVDRETGESGRLDHGVALTPSSLRGYVETLDRRRSGGKPVIYSIHRPGPLSVLTGTGLSRADYTAAMRTFRATGALPEGIEGRFNAQGRPVGLRRKDPSNPKASDGKYLVPELLTKPMKARAKALRKTLGPELVKLTRSR